VEQYLSTIDISLLETPSPEAKTIEDVLDFIGAKDEREAITVMYQTLFLIEVYTNRVIEYGLITLYNASKLNANKFLDQYVESDYNVITELAQEYLRLSSIKQKQKKNNLCEDNKTIPSGNHSEDYKKVVKQHEELKKKYEEIVTRFNELNLKSSINAAKIDISETGTKKLKDEIEKLKVDLEKEKNLHEEHVRTIKEKEIEISSLVDKINTIKASCNSY